MSSLITESLYRMYWPKAARVKPLRVVKLLTTVGIRFVVVGAHGCNGYRSETQATQDLDILVRRRDHKKAILLVKATYPRLDVEDNPLATSFIDPVMEMPAIDLIKPCLPLLRLTFRNSVAVGNQYRIPSLEMVLATQFATMISTDREMSKRYLDAGNFIDIVQQNCDDLDMTRLTRLGEVVFKGGGPELIQKVEEARAGGAFKFWEVSIPSD